MEKSFRLASIVAVCILLASFSGCAYKIQVQGVRNPDVPTLDPDGAGIYVEPGTHIGSGKCPVSAEKMTSMVVEMARKKGFRVVSQEEADYILRFDYESLGYEGRVRLQPESGPVTGFKTVGKGGPFDQRLWVRVMEARKTEGEGEPPVIWTGTASVQAASTEGCRMAAMLLVAAFNEFPKETDGQVVRRMSVSDSRVTALKK